MEIDIKDELHYNTGLFVTQTKVYFQDIIVKLITNAKTFDSGLHKIMVQGKCVFLSLLKQPFKLIIFIKKQF